MSGKVCSNPVFIRVPVFILRVKNFYFSGQFRQKVAKSKKSHNFNAVAERVSELDSVNSSSPQN